MVLESHFKHDKAAMVKICLFQILATPIKSELIHCLHSVRLTLK